MSQKTKKQFGVWLDTHQAIIIGRSNPELSEFSVLGYSGDGGAPNSNEKNEGNEKGGQHKFYKDILKLMQNAEEIHLTGTGTSQEQFINYLSDIPQFKNTLTSESTSNKMSDENLVDYISERFNKGN